MSKQHSAFWPFVVDDGFKSKDAITIYNIHDEFDKKCNYATDPHTHNHIIGAAGRPWDALEGEWAEQDVCDLRRACAQVDHDDDDDASMIVMVILVIYQVNAIMKMLSFPM